jgi:hypothetical protein
MSFVSWRTVALIGLTVLPASCFKRPAPVVARADFHGWKSISLRSPAAEVVVVPAIGRVMQFGPPAGGGGAPSGPFWSHPGLGVALAADENGWINYGGDKAWPAPQSDWSAIVGRGWPPPRTFDSTPYTLSVDGARLQLVSPVDPAYGIRVRRTIALDPVDPVLTIETTFEKTQGPGVRVAVWTITQLSAPERLFVLLPERSVFPDGYALHLPAAPRDLRRDGPLLSLARDPVQKTMIGSDGNALLWIGSGLDLLIENLTDGPSDPAAATARWPADTQAQVYTNPGASEGYVELELLGRLRDLEVGQSASMTVRYTLKVRRQADPLAEARAVFGAVGAARGAGSPGGTAP